MAIKLNPKYTQQIKTQSINRKKNSVSSDIDSLRIFGEFIPNPGGQTEFFNKAQWLNDYPLPHKWLALLGGINSGKSFSGAVWACSRALIDPTSRGMISANSYGQLARATLVTLVEVCRMFDIPLEPWRDSPEEQALAIANCQRCYIGHEKAFVYVLSANAFAGNTQAGRGLQVRWFWGDEFAYAPEQSFLTIDGRLDRGPGKLKGQGIITTSPCGHNYLWDKFGDMNRADSLQKLYQLVSVSSLENVYSSEEYLQSLQANYNDELYKQEILGLFVNVTEGLVYKYFNRSKHSLRGEDSQLIDYDRNLPLLLTFDFNYNPAICLAAQVRNNEVHFFKEWFLLDSDIWELTNQVAQWIEKAGIPYEIQIFGDATGRARTANSRLSSWDIVFEGLDHLSQYGRGHLRRRFANSNPYVQNRIHSVNLLFQKNRCFINYDHCSNLIKDFEQVTWDDQGINKTEDKLRSHLSDAAGYLIHTLYPFKREPAELRPGKVSGLSS